MTLNLNSLKKSKREKENQQKKTKKYVKKI